MVIADIDDQAAAENVERIEVSGGQAISMHVDVALPAEVHAVVEEAVSSLGRLDFLVQNAFSAIEGEARIRGGAEEVDEALWDRGFDVLVKALYVGVRHAVPHLRRAGGGVIVNLASVHGLLQEPGMLVYEAAKAAVVGMTRQMATEYGPDAIRVNAVAPGFIATEGLAAAYRDDPAGLELFANQYPLRRVGVPDDVAGAIAFLCSRDAAFITGHTLVVDGGLTVQLQEGLGIRQARYAREHPDTDIRGPGQGPK